MEWSKGDVKRTKIPLLGIDIALIQGEAAVRHALATGDLVRVEEAVEFEDLQWLFKKFFNLSRFGSEPHGRFMPMRKGDDKAYLTSRQVVDNAMAEGAFPALKEHAKKIARLLVDPQKLEDRAIGAAFAHAIGDRFGVVPADIVAAAGKQTGGLVDVFLPWKAWPAKSALANVYKYWEGIATARGLEPEGTVDLAHTILAPTDPGIPLLKALAKDTDRPVEEVFTSVGQVEQVLRMTTRDSTLGGMFPADNPIKARETVIRVNIRKAAQDSCNLAFAFGHGTNDRRCAAEKELIRLFRLVQAEILRLRAQK